MVRAVVFWKLAEFTMFWTETAAADSCSMVRFPLSTTTIAACPLLGKKVADAVRKVPSGLWVR